MGVPPGVEFGVDELLSTLDFLEPDLGVTLELRNVLTGVTISSFEATFDVRLGGSRGSRPSSGDEYAAGDPASRGVI